MENPAIAALCAEVAFAAFVTVAILVQVFVFHVKRRARRNAEAAQIERRLGESALPWNRWWEAVDRNLAQRFGLKPVGTEALEWSKPEIEAMRKHGRVPLDDVNRIATPDDAAKREFNRQAHWSDCAVNNGPALAPGPCDCVRNSADGAKPFSPWHTIPPMYDMWPIERSVCSRCVSDGNPKLRLDWGGWYHERTVDGTTTLFRCNRDTEARRRYALGLVSAEGRRSRAMG